MKKFIMIFIGLLFISTSALSMSFDTDVGQETELKSDFDLNSISVDFEIVQITEVNYKHYVLHKQTANTGIDNLNSDLRILLNNKRKTFNINPGSVLHIDPGRLNLKKESLIDTNSFYIDLFIDPGWCI